LIFRLINAFVVMPLVHNQNNFCNFAMASRKICKDVEMKTYDFGIRSFGFQSLFSDFYVKRSIIQSQSLRQFCWLIFIQIENTLSIEKKNWTSIYDKSFLKSRLYLMPFFFESTSSCSAFTFTFTQFFSRRSLKP